MKGAKACNHDYIHSYTLQGMDTIAFVWWIERGTCMIICLLDYYSRNVRSILHDMHEASNTIYSYHAIA